MSLLHLNPVTRFPPYSSAMANPHIPSPACIPVFICFLKNTRIEQWLRRGRWREVRRKEVLQCFAAAITSGIYFPQVSSNSLWNIQTHQLLL